jgi:hypothetical protein
MIALYDQPPSSLPAPPRIESEAEQRDRLERRLRAWLASGPSPAAIVDTLCEVARRLDDSLPGGLTIVTADVYLDIVCECLLYCDLAELQAVWPRLRDQRRD